MKMTKNTEDHDHAKHYMECHGLTRRIAHELALQLRSEPTTVSIEIASVYEKCQREAIDLGESEPTEDQLDICLSNAVESKWLKLAKNKYSITKNGWSALGWNRDGESLAPCLSTVGRESFRPQQVRDIAAWVATPKILEILTCVRTVEIEQAKNDASQPVATKPKRNQKFEHDPRVNRVGEITIHELHNWTACVHWSVDGFLSAMQRLVTLGFVYVVGTGPLQKAFLVAATDAGCRAYDEYKRLGGDSVESEALTIFTIDEGGDLKELLRCAIRRFIINGSVDLKQRISRIPDRELRNSVSDAAACLGWPEAGVRFDELIRVMMSGAAHRIQGSVSDSFDSLLQLFNTNIRNRALWEINGIVSDSMKSLAVQDIVDVIRELLSSQAIHVTGIHSTLVGLPAIEEVVFAEGLPPKDVGTKSQIRKIRLTIDTTRQAVFLDNNLYELTEYQVDLLKCLVNKPNSWLSSSAMIEQLGRSKGSRPDLILKELPDAFNNILEKQGGNGTRILLDEDQIEVIGSPIP